jgi:hypothetical protein
MTGAHAIAAAMVVMALALVGYAVVSLIEARRRKKGSDEPCRPLTAALLIGLRAMLKYPSDGRAAR